jgi:hypothetical protein
MGGGRKVRIGLLGVAVAACLAPALAAGAARFEEEAPAAPDGRLRVRLDAGSIEVEPGGDDAVRVEASYTGAMDFALRSDGRDVELEGRSQGFLGLFGGGRVQVRLRVPARFSLDLQTAGGSLDLSDVGGSVRARTSGGSIALDGARARAELETSGGSIEAWDVADRVVARTSGGGITVVGARGGVDVETSGGNLRIHDVQGPVRARTSGGSISLRFAARPEGDVRTSGGSIEAELPEGAGVDLEARTSGGRVEVDAPLVVRGELGRDRVLGALFGGGPGLRLETSGGNIRVRVR